MMGVAGLPLSLIVLGHDSPLYWTPFLLLKDLSERPFVELQKGWEWFCLDLARHRLSWKYAAVCEIENGDALLAENHHSGGAPSKPGRA